jgi:subtilisin-like proprotein convertase family protein
VVQYNGGHTQTITFSIPTGASPTHVSTDVPKAIPDDDPTGATSVIPITAPGNVVSLTVRLTIHHTYDPDLAIQLISPTGTTITLAYLVGYNGSNSSPNFIDTVFDDAATTSIDAGSAPFTGSFQPDQALAPLVGTAINGTWKLFIADNAAIDTGTIDQWSLNIQPSVAACALFPPPTVTSINPASGDVKGGTAVTIKGTNFGGTTTVTFDTQPATNVTVVDSTTITAVTPAHPAGAATVTVTTNGTTLPLATPFTYGGTNPIPPVQPPGPVIPGVVPDPVPGTRPGAVPPPSGGQPPAPLPPKR